MLMAGKQVPVSVIIPCYRCSGTIGRAVASVASQTMVPAEVILIDDGSRDGTLNRLQQLRDLFPGGWIRVIELPENAGPGTARNAGWEQATQQFVAFLDADDAWHPQKIELQYSWMDANPDVALSSHACVLADGDGSEKHKAHPATREITFRQISPRQCLISNRFPTRSVMLKRCLPHRFAPGKRYSEDFLLWCDICLDGYRCCRSEASLAFLYKAEYGEGGLSRNLWEMQKGQMDTYCRLRKSGRITELVLSVLLAWSVIRFVRRIMITRLRRNPGMWSAFRCMGRKDVGR